MHGRPGQGVTLGNEVLIVGGDPGIPILSIIAHIVGGLAPRHRHPDPTGLHVDDLLLSDPATALLAGLATLPKKSALTAPCQACTWYPANAPAR
ncbi:MAG: hypothetical protein ACRDQZ_22195, partial [Mycobacteriales bacterium]